jgi:hypothetical protein
MRTCTLMRHLAHGCAQTVHEPLFEIKGVNELIKLRAGLLPE